MADQIHGRKTIALLHGGDDGFNVVAAFGISAG